MALSPRTTFLFAPVLGEIAIQGVVWAQGSSVERFEDGLAGVQMMMSAMPSHGQTTHPWVLLSFPLFCVFSWELLEFIRDHAPMRQLPGGKVDQRAIATGAARRLYGLVIGALGMLLFNFGMMMATLLLVVIIEASLLPRESMGTFFASAIGIAYPIPLGFIVLWAYRNISRPPRGQGETESV